MRPAQQLGASYQAPVILNKAEELANYLRTLTTSNLQSTMKLSPVMAEKTHELATNWSADSSWQRPAIDSFLGDIYSGLQAQSFTQDERSYANEHLFILSGLYGVLRACDSIHHYRLEMGYKLPHEPYKNLYAFWGDAIAKQLPVNRAIINLSAVEYTKAVFPHIPDTQIITPKFLTVSPKTGQPTFVTVHAKIARGTFARWLVTQRIQNPVDIIKFNDIGYLYDKATSTPHQPVFICKNFEGTGLSVRLT